MAEWDDDERNTKVLFRWDRPPSPELSLGDILRDLHTADTKYDDDQHDPMPCNEEELCEDHEYEEEELCEYDQHNLMPSNEDDDGDAQGAEAVSRGQSRGRPSFLWLVIANHILLC